MTFQAEMTLRHHRCYVSVFTIDPAPADRRLLPVHGLDSFGFELTKISNVYLEGTRS